MRSRYQWGSPVVLASLALALALLAPVRAGAQSSPGTDAGGFQPGRAYFSPEPWEHFDTQSGNLMFSFTDLVLLGNAGQDLRFVRYGGNGGAPTMGPGPLVQRLGLDGYVMSIAGGLGFPGVGTQIDREHPQWFFEGPPTLLFPDGASKQMFYELTPDTSADNQANPQDPNLGSIIPSMRWVVSVDLIRYDQWTGMLYMRDGRQCHYGWYGPARVLEWCKDAFNQDLIELQRDGAVLTVTQHVGAQTRTVVVTYASGADLSWASVNPILPVSMTYGDRTWQYIRANDTLTVTPPAGPPWVFTPTTVTTPAGGIVTYTYTAQFQVHPWSPECQDPNFWNSPGQEHGVALTRRDSSGPDVTPGVWNLSYDFRCMPSSVELYGRLHPILTVSLTKPSGVSATYNGSSCSSQSNDPFWGVYYVGNTSVTCQGPTPSGYPAQDIYEQKTFKWYSNAQVELKRMVRKKRKVQSCDAWPSTGCAWYTTEFTEDAQSQTVTKIEETNEDGALKRTTEYTYHTAWPYSVLPTSETVTVSGCGGDPTPCGQIQQLWNRNAGTGFVEQATAGGVTTAYTPDAYGNVASATTSSHTTTFTYDWGQVASVATPEHTVTRTINPDGTVASETEGTSPPRTTTYTYEYTPQGQRTVTQGPGGTAPTIIESTSNAVITTRGTARVKTTLDGFGRPIRTETGDTSGYTSRMVTQYDAEGRTRFVGRPLDWSAPEPGHGTWIDYDWLGRVWVETHTDNTTRTHSYTRTTEWVTDENGHTTALALQRFGNPTEGAITSLQDAKGVTWSYTYTVAGDLARVLGPDGVHRDWTYDANTQRLTSEQHPESGTVDYLLYDAAGVLRQARDANQTLWEYTPDANGRLRFITATPVNGPVQVTAITYEAGSDRQETATVTVGGQIESSTVFGYDTAGRLAMRTDTVDGKTFAVTYTYDAGDYLKTITYPSGREVQYDYDTQNRLFKVFNVATPHVPYASGFSYHPSGALTGYTAGNGVITFLTYDAPRQRLESVNVGQGNNRLQLVYAEYDDVGNIKTINDWRDGHSQTFHYDALDRLKDASGIYGTIVYQYDAHGNRQTANQGTYTYDPGNLFRLKSINGGFNLTYDANGNLTGGFPGQNTYTPDNLLAISQISGGATARFTYDADAWRLKKAVDGGTTYYYVRGPNGQLLSEWVNTSPAAVKDYLYAGGRLVGVATTTAPPK